MDFEINLIFLIKAFIFINQDKNTNILRTKRDFKVKKKVFLSFLKGFQLPKIASDLRVRLSVNEVYSQISFSKNSYHMQRRI